MKGFHFVLLAQAIYFSIGVIISVTVPKIRNAIRMTEGLFIDVGIGLFMIGCISLRLAVHFEQCVPTALVLFVLYTTGLTLIGSQLAVWLQEDYGTDSDVNFSEQTGQGEQRGQTAICMACIIIPVVFVIVQSKIITKFQQSHTTTTTTTIKSSGLQAVSLVLLLSGLCMITIDDREWDWRYAMAIFLALVISVYLNAISTWFVHQSPQNNHQHLLKASAPDAFHLAALIILQPILFAEDWLLLCLLGA